jgi:hypothetical protein
MKSPPVAGILFLTLSFVAIVTSSCEGGCSQNTINVNFADMFRGFGGFFSPTPAPTPKPTTPRPTTPAPLPDDKDLRCVQPNEVASAFPPFVSRRMSNFFALNNLLYETNLDLPTTVNMTRKYMEETAYMYLPVTGTFGGPDNHGLEGLVEYSWIVNRYKNGGWGYKKQALTNQVCWSANIPDVLKINGTGTAVYNSRYLPDNVTLIGGSEVETGSASTIYYDPGSDLIDHLVVDLGRTEQEGKLIFQMARNYHDVCKVIMENCVGPNQAFSSLLECIDYQSSLPLIKCYPNFGEGDSYGCRFLHHFMTAFNPEVHCPHTTPSSQVCVDTACKAGFYQHDFCKDESSCP